MDNIFSSWALLAKHMEEKHPTAKYFGDTLFFSLKTGVVKSQRCQKCGEDLVQPDADKIEDLI